MIAITELIETPQYTLSISGRVEFDCRQVFNAALEKAIQTKPRAIILNVTKVSFINSAGLGLLMGAHKKLKEAKIPFTLEVCPGFVLDILNTTNMASMIPLSHKVPDVIPSGPSKPSSVSPLQVTSTLSFHSDEMEALLLPILKLLEKESLDLPLLPDVARQVLSLTADPNAASERLTSVIQQDPVLMAKIFKTANSAGYGASQRIESLQQAIGWLGMSMVQSLTIALALQANVFNDRGYEREVRGLWAHAIATAFYGKMIARLINVSQDDAFLCGLLHSIGKLVVIHHFNESRGASPDALRWSVVVSIVEQSYVEVGRQVANSWNFPCAVKEAITQHQTHSFQFATHPSRGAAITCLAGHVASSHLDAVPLSEESLRALPVTAVLNIPENFMDEMRKTKSIVHAQVEGLLA